MFRPAACVVIPTYNTIEEIFAVSRRNDFTQWGIPGGKQEVGESNLDAAIREIREECGVLLDPLHLHPIHVGPCYGKDGNNFWVTAYLYKQTIPFEDMTSENGFKIQPMELLNLCQDNISPFAPFNNRVISSWRLLSDPLDRKIS